MQSTAHLRWVSQPDAVGRSAQLRPDSGRGRLLAENLRPGPGLSEPCLSAWYAVPIYPISAFMRRGFAGVGSRKAKIILLAIVSLGMGCPPSTVLSQQLIVNPETDLTTAKAQKVRAIFSMRLRRWPDGAPVRVFVLPDQNPVHQAFSKKILGVLPYRLRRAWDRAVFSGTGQAPTEVRDEEEMLERISATPGAVGYISDEIGDDRVRIVPVE